MRRTACVAASDARPVIDKRPLPATLARRGQRASAILWLATLIHSCRALRPLFWLEALILRSHRSQSRSSRFLSTPRHQHHRVPFLAKRAVYAYPPRTSVHTMPARTRALPCLVCRYLFVLLLAALSIGFTAAQHTSSLARGPNATHTLSPRIRSVRRARRLTIFDIAEINQFVVGNNFSSGSRALGHTARLGERRVILRTLPKIVTCSNFYR